MRDAFGGSFMLKLFLVFIIVYVFFTAMALNYAKAFKVKNKVIEYLENNEITDISKMTATAKKSMEDYFEHEILGNMNYTGECGCKKNAAYCDYGIEIITTSPKASERNKLGVYHTVNTCIGWNISFVRVLGRLNGDVSNEGGNSFGTWKISGQTRPIANEK